MAVDACPARPHVWWASDGCDAAVAEFDEMTRGRQAALPVGRADRPHLRSGLVCRVDHHDGDADLGEALEFHVARQVQDAESTMRAANSCHREPAIELAWGAHGRYADAVAALGRRDDSAVDELLGPWADLASHRAFASAEEQIHDPESERGAGLVAVPAQFVGDALPGARCDICPAVEHLRHCR